MKSLRLVIHGRVQGVGYRDWLVKVASMRGLHGWVRNLTDGTVEAVLSGPESDVLACLSACREGPAFADISKIEAYPWKDAVLPGFTRRQTSPPTRQEGEGCL